MSQLKFNPIHARRLGLVLSLLVLSVLLLAAFVANPAAAAPPKVAENPTEPVAAVAMALTQSITETGTTTETESMTETHALTETHGMTATESITDTGAMTPTEMRWDIIALTSFSPPTIEEGGVTFALGNDGSYIKLTGSGTFGPGVDDPVTGGGEWTTYDHSNKLMGTGTYSVTEFISFEPAPGQQGPNDVDMIGDKADARSGLVVLTIAYMNEDGDPDGTGILIVSCHQPVGSPHDMFEGVIASKSAVTYFHPAFTMPGVNANRTLFHVVR